MSSVSWPRIMAWAALGAILIAAVATLASRISSCLCEPDASTVVVNRDPTGKFEDVHAETYRPPSIPIIEKRGRSPVPPGIDEKKVERVVKIHLKDRDVPLSIVEMKTGDILLEKDSTVSKVEIVDFTPPFLSFEIRFGLGLSSGPETDGAWSIRPAAAATIVEIAGTVRIPVLLIDTRQVGLGSSARIYYEIWAGGGAFWEYSDLSRRSLRLFIHYTL